MSYVSNHVHIVFGTKDHWKLISPALQPKLWAYLAGIAKNCAITPLAIGGMEEHVHLLLEIPPTLSIAKVVQVLKANSSRWVRETDRSFGWQEKYGAFSVSRSDLDAVSAYIRNQAEHHRRRDFKTEFQLLLRKHGISLDS